MKIEVDEKDLVGFNEPAKQKLEKSTHEFVSNVIEEAHRLESKGNSSSGEPEVTSSNVADAYIFVSRGLVKQKKSKAKLALKALSVLLPLIVGVMYDATKLQDSTFLLLFMVLGAITAIIVTISFVGE